MEVQPDGRVLEIGFGPGVSLAYLAQQAQQVIGVDVSGVMVQQARKRNAQAIAAGRVELHQASAERLPLAAASYDKVLSINSIQIWPDPAAGLREVRRVLKPGGRLALGFAGPALPFEPQAAALLGETGFELERRIEGPRGVCLLATGP
jgi:ubiquinone/menaquinone biosynthesis C-methylase UbiE